jgi:hypothetical protein
MMSNVANVAHTTPGAATASAGVSTAFSGGSCFSLGIRVLECRSNWELLQEYGAQTGLSAASLTERHHTGDGKRRRGGHAGAVGTGHKAASRSRSARLRSTPQR